MGDMATLPVMTRAWPWTLDLVRVVIRQHPELQTLGRKHGPVKVYTAAEGAVIRRVMEVARPLAAVAAG